MSITALEIKDKTFSTKFRGFNPEEVDEFLDIIVGDFEDLVRSNHEKDSQIKSLEEKLSYFDEMKETLTQSVLIAQDTSEKVQQAAQAQSDQLLREAEQKAQRLLEEAEQKANLLLREAADHAKQIAIETEELKNKTRLFHQQLRSTIEGQLSMINSAEWEEILRPTATYLQTSDEAFRQVVKEVLGEKELAKSKVLSDEEIDVTRQFSPEEMAELQKKLEETNSQADSASMEENQLANESNPPVIEEGDRESVTLL